MGTFFTGCKIENHVDRSRSVRISKLLVDTGSEYTWVPAAKLEKIGVEREKKDLRFTMANGQIVTRSAGFAILRVGESFTIDEVVFAEPGDLFLLGARTLEGLNLVVDSARKKLVAAGPIPAASQLSRGESRLDDASGGLKRIKRELGIAHSARRRNNES
jgi:predicted aspartyl protease